MKRTITAFIHKSNSKSSFTISENVNGRNIRKSTSTYVNVNWKTFLRVVLPKKCKSKSVYKKKMYMADGKTYQCIFGTVT